MIETRVATVRRPTADYLARVLTETGARVGRTVPDGPARVPAAAVYRLWDEAERSAADAAIGLRAAARSRAGDFGVLGTVFEQAPTLGEALTEMSRLLPLTSDSVRAVLVVNGPRTTYELVVDEPALWHPRSAEHMVAMTAFAVRRRLRGRGSFALTAHWTHPAPGPVADHERLLGVRVQFEAAWNGLSFATEALRIARPGPGADLDEARRRADEALRRRTRPGLVVHVRDLIAVESRAGRPVTEESVARRLGLHPKSLARRLAARGTTFRRQVDEVRFDRARRLLEAGRPVAEVARRVGYADASAFSRAFKRWSGSAPSTYAHRSAGTSA